MCFLRLQQEGLTAEASRIVCYKSGVSDSGTDQWELVGRVPLAGASKDVQDMHGQNGLSLAAQRSKAFLAR